jgi:uncharacterized protein (TIGR03437 family)
MANTGKIACAVVLGLKLLAGAAQAQPVISEVANAASYLLPPLPGSAIAQGSFFVIRGTGTASSSEVVTWGTYPLPTILDGTSVSITVGGTTTAAYMYYVGPSWGSSGTQIDAVVPSTTPTGSGVVVVTHNGASSQPFPITVVAISPGVYSLNGSGTGPGAFYNVASDGSLEQNTLFNSAKPMQTVTLFATGLGPASNPATEGSETPAQIDIRNGNFQVEVYVGVEEATVQYVGRSSYTGEDQINFLVPGEPQGCYVNVAVYAGPPGNQTVSNFPTLSVAPQGRTCSDADGIDMGDLEVVITSNGFARVGSIALLSSYLDLTIPLSGQLPWDNDTVNGEIVTLFTQQLDSSLGYTLLPSQGSCAVSQFLGYVPVPEVPADPVLTGIFGPVTWLDAGASLSIEGPNGTQPVPKNTNGEGYNGLVGGETITDLLIGGGLPPFFLNSAYDILPGNYTVTGPGGSNVGAFSGDISVSTAAASFQWTNQGSITSGPIPRNTPLTITWSGGDPEGFVEIVAIASTDQSGITPPATTPGILAQCVTPARLSSFQILPWVLQALPSTTSSTALIPPAYLMVGPVSGAVKIATPSGLDAAYLFYHYLQGASVTWQ